MKLWTAIKDHPIFNNPNARKSQASLQYQLMVLLKYLGTEGDGMSNSKARSIFPSGYGSFDVYKDQCVQAIIESLGKTSYFWPSAAERKQIASRFDNR